MKLNEPAWCSCGEHLVDPAASRPECPVCIDKAAKAAKARMVELGWRVYGTGGAA